MSAIPNDEPTQDEEQTPSDTASPAAETSALKLDESYPVTSGKKSPLASQATSSQEPSEAHKSTASAEPIDSPGHDQPTELISQGQRPNPACSATESVPRVNSVYDLEMQLKKATKDLESMVLKYARSERDNLLNKNKVGDIDKRMKRIVKDNESLANRIKLLTNDKNQLTETLSAKVAQLTVLEQKNIHLNTVQQARLQEIEAKALAVEKENEDLSKQIESYKSKEGELMDFSERLSMKHMLLQSELDEALKSVPSFKAEYDAARKQLDHSLKQLEKQRLLNESLQAELVTTRENHDKTIAEKENLEKQFKNSVDELKNENQVMRRRHQIAIKELTKEIKRLNFRLESESSSNCHKDISTTATLET